MPQLITLLSGASSNGAPSSLTDATLGVAVPFLTDQAIVYVHNTAGTGTVTATVRLWGFSRVMNRWYALGTGSNPGYLNGGSAIGEISTVADTLAQAELIYGLRDMDRLYAEIISVGGVGTAITVAVSCTKAEPVTSA